MDLFVIYAPSGTGKTTLVRALRTATATVRLAISHTTRPMRRNEQDGVDYYFTTKQQFKQLIAADALAEHAVVFNHYYGTHTSEITRIHLQGKSPVLEIDWQGAFQVRAAFPQATLIGIIPPSLAVLAQRLQGRNSDSAAQQRIRLQEATLDIGKTSQADYLVVNTTIAQALEQLLGIIVSRQINADYQRQARALVASMV